MIPRTIPTVQGISTDVPQWQEDLRTLITEPEVLLQRLEISEALSPNMLAAMASFPLRVTESFVSRMKVGDINDPLLQQVLPLAAELEDLGDWTSDPLQETRFRKQEGLIHKYKGRVLLIAAPQCAINCRYCFRRHFDYKQNSPSRREWLEVFDYVSKDNSIQEVILSGGDPLILADKQLHWLLEQAESIEHVKRFRIHTRLPVVLPSRLTPALLRRFQTSRLSCIVVIHANHPNEINSELAESLKQLSHFGITALNQSVLLKNINDCSEIITLLSNKLFECGVLPYYLHLLDKVKGAKHFCVPKAAARELYKKIRAELPGYLVPQLVEEIPGENSKTIVL